MTLDRGIIHQTLAAASVFSNTFMRGMVIGWIAPTVVKFKNGEYDLSATNRELAWITSIHSVGRFFGSLLMALFLDRMGRRHSIMTASFSFFILWLLMVFVRSIILICLLGLLMGVILGVHDVVSPIYLAENCSPKMRAIMGGTSLLWSDAGVIVENILTTYASYSTAAAANAIICGCMSLSTFFLKETPYYLVMKGRQEGAIDNLLWLRGQSTIDKDTGNELDKIQQNMQSEMLKKRSLTLALKSAENYEPVMMIMICNLLIVLTGHSAVVGFSSMIFQSTSTFSAKEFTILLGVFELLAACILPFIVGQFNRRTLLLSSLLVMIICSTCTFIFHSIEFVFWKEYLPWLIFTTVSLQYMLCSWALYILGIIRGELLPMSVKAVGGCLAIMTNALVVGICLSIFLPITTTYGIQYNYIFFIFFSIIAFVYVFKAVPETKGKTLVDIQISLQSKPIL